MITEFILPYTADDISKRLEKIDKIDYLLNYITPEMFGAVGDGITDDTVAIQKAIDYITNEEINGKLLFQNSIYLVTDTINITKGGFVIQGNGKHGRTDNGCKGTHIRYKGNPNKAVFSTRGYEDFTYGLQIRDIRFATDGNGGLTALDLYKCSEIVLYNVTVNGGFDHAIVMEDVGIGTIEDCNLSDNENGFYLKQVNTLWFSHINCWINSNSAFVFKDECKQITIRDSWIENSLNCIEVDSANERTSLVNLILENTSFTSTVEGSRFIKAIYTESASSANLLLLDTITIMNCHVYIEKTTYAMEFVMGEYPIKSFMLINSKFTCNDLMTSAIYSNLKTNLIFILGRCSFEDLRANEVPAISGLYSSTIMSPHQNYLNLNGNRAILFPSSAELQSVSPANQVYCKDGFFRITDGQSARYVPVQGETVSASTATTIEALVSDFNNLITVLKNSKAIS